MVTIELFGQSHTFKADTEAARANEVADLLKREVEKVQDQQTGSSTHIPKLTILILAALNIAQNIIQLNKDAGDIVDLIARRCEALNRMLDEGLVQLTSLRPNG
ncbi:MAG TPA: cell division protein ZapA [Desulfobacterales bacterium]|jgi:cell division protein ZapA (FtsZ GTPase activity inhibitor)|nr:cell division protein ZapA [Desulfobacterales bacterium]HSM89825.1 cell division protein ZapA [Desulfobacterales bacterium]